MKVKFRTSCAGTNFSYGSNREYDLELEQALGFIKCGYALPVEADLPQLAVAPVAERTAVLPSRKKRS